MATSVAQIAVAVGRPTPAPGSTDDLQWRMWIEDALLEISAGPTGTSHIDLATFDQDRLDRVVRDAVAAKVKRPDDATQVTVAVDDASTSRTYSSSTGAIFIRPEWWRFLGLVAESNAFSVRPAFVPDGPCL